MNRRELFDPHRLAQTAGHVLAACEDSVAQLEPPEQELPLLRIGRRAMATGFEIALPLGTPHALQAAEEGLDVVNQLESQMTVYRDDSEMSRINRHAAISLMPVESQLFAL